MTAWPLQDKPDLLALHGTMEEEYRGLGEA